MAQIAFKDKYKTILTISVGFGAIFLLTNSYWAIYTSIGIGILALISSKIADLIVTLWEKITWILSLIIPNILLSLVFFLILSPMAFLSKWLGQKDPLLLKRNTSPESTFLKKNKQYSPESFKNPW